FLPTSGDVVPSAPRLSPAMRSSLLPFREHGARFLPPPRHDAASNPFFVFPNLPPSARVAPPAFRGPSARHRDLPPSHRFDSLTPPSTARARLPPHPVPGLRHRGVRKESQHAAAPVPWHFRVAPRDRFARR